MADDPVNDLKEQRRRLRDSSRQVQDSEREPAYVELERVAAWCKERGIDAATIEQVTWQNALDAYAQSGQIDVEALLAAPSIDQSQTFLDNTVLRGQDPRIDEPVAG